MSSNPSKDKGEDIRLPKETKKINTVGSFELKDSGERHTFPTGAVREAAQGIEGKGAYYLLPQHPLRRVAEIYRKGALKYQKRNWERGLPLSSFVDSGFRHFQQFLEGMEDEDHLHQAIWNLMGLSHTMEMIRRGLLPEELNDLPSYGINGTEIEVRPGVVCSKWREPGKGHK